MLFLTYIFPGASSLDARKGPGQHGGGLPPSAGRAGFTDNAGAT